MCEYIYAVADKNSLDRRLKRLEHQHSHEEDVRDDKIVGRALEKVQQRYIALASNGFF